MDLQKSGLDLIGRYQMAMILVVYVKEAMGFFVLVISVLISTDLHFKVNCSNDILRVQRVHFG